MADYGNIYGSGVAAQDAPVEVGPFSMAGQAYEDVHNLVRRIHMLADRLCGPTGPQEAQASGANIDHKPPLFVALRMESNRAASAVREAHDALERIERQLS